MMELMTNDVRIILHDSTESRSFGVRTMFAELCFDHTDS